MGGLTMYTRIKKLLKTHENGSAAVEMSLYVGIFGLIIILLIMAARLSVAGDAIESVASAAARTASLARTTVEAQDRATQAAHIALDQENLNCLQLEVTINSNGLDKPLGEIGTVAATISCTVNFRDIAVPGVPGTKTLTATASSPVDAYRERR